MNGVVFHTSVRMITNEPPRLPSGFASSATSGSPCTNPSWGRRRNAMRTRRPR